MFAVLQRQMIPSLVKNVAVKVAGMKSLTGFLVVHGMFVVGVKVQVK